MTFFPKLPGFFKMREAVIDIVSGSVAGMVSTAVGHPFDTLKDVDSTENSVRVRFG